jgi:hypothetical protein
MKVDTIRLRAVALIGAAILLGSCSNTPNTSDKGMMRLHIGATPTTMGGTAPAVTGEDDALSHLTAATITISSIEVHSTADGTWVPVASGLPVTLDLLAIMNSGGTATLPADLVPPGTYDAIQLGITKLDLTLTDGTMVSVTPPGTGWTVQIPVTFTVVAGQATDIKLNVHCDGSFHLLNGVFEFDPEIDGENEDHDDARHR